MNRRHKYLEKFSFDSETCIPNTSEKDRSDRDLTFKRQRKKYGFDERETWGLDFTSACWLYEHLCMYMDIGGKVVDLDFYKFDVPVLEYNGYNGYNGGKQEWSDGVEKWYKHTFKTMTQRECIELCMSYLSDYLKEDRDLPIDKSIACEQMAGEKLQCAFWIYSIIIPAMWW